jgi:hypothetical protein
MDFNPIPYIKIVFFPKMWNLNIMLYIHIYNYSTSFFIISETACTNVMDYVILEGCHYLPHSELKTGSRIMSVITGVKIFPHWKP